MANACTVLVVDDEPPIRRFLRTSLSAADHRVVTAEDGTEALKMLARPSYRTRAEVDAYNFHFLLRADSSRIFMRQAFFIGN
jgi:CheY-like chemotaxis protein